MGINNLRIIHYLILDRKDAKVTLCGIITKLQNEVKKGEDLWLTPSHLEVTCSECLLRLNKAI